MKTKAMTSPQSTADSLQSTVHSPKSDSGLETVDSGLKFGLETVDCGLLLAFGLF